MDEFLSFFLGILNGFIMVFMWGFIEAYLKDKKEKNNGS